MAEGKSQQKHSILDPIDEGLGPTRRTVGYEIPERDIAHEDPEWFQRDLDQPIEDPDDEWIDKLPTERHRKVPGFD